MRKLVPIVLVAVTAVAGFSVPSAQALDTTVHLDVDIAATHPMADCDLAVAEGSNGIDVLDAAVASGCIEVMKRRPTRYSASS